MLLGLSGDRPEFCDPRAVEGLLGQVRQRRLSLLGTHEIGFDEDTGLVMHRRRSLPLPPNGMTFTAWHDSDEVLAARTFYSVGGGFVIGDHAGQPSVVTDTAPVAHPFRTGSEL